MVGFDEPKEQNYACEAKKLSVVYKKKVQRITKRDFINSASIFILFVSSNFKPRTLGATYPVKVKGLVCFCSNEDDTEHVL